MGSMLALHPRPVSPAEATTLLSAAPVSVACGFPSPAQDYVTETLSLDERLIRDKEATFIVEASGSSMVDAGISDGDPLLVEKGRTPEHGDIVVAVLNGELTIKRLHVGRGAVVLRSESGTHPDIVVDELSELTIWGVVTWSLHRVR